MEKFFIYLPVFMIKTLRLNMKGKVSQNSFDLAMNYQVFQPVFRRSIQEGAGLCHIRRHLQTAEFFCVLRRLLTTVSTSE